MLTLVIQDGVVTAAEVGLDQPSAGSRSAWFPAQRYSITKFRPSTYPVWFKPRRRPVTRAVSDSGDPKFKYPMTGSAASCACAAIGRAPAPREELASS